MATHEINLYPSAVTNTNYSALISGGEISAQNDRDATIDLGYFLFDNINIPSLGTTITEAALKYKAKTNRENESWYSAKVQITPYIPSSITKNNNNTFNYDGISETGNTQTTSNLVGDTGKSYNDYSNDFKSFINDSSYFNNKIMCNIKIIIDTTVVDVIGYIKDLKLYIKYTVEEGYIFIDEYTYDGDLSTVPQNTGLGGTITTESVEDGGKYEFGTSYSLTAIEKSNYKFKYWKVKNPDNTETEIIENPLIKIIENETIMIEAWFERINYTISTVSSSEIMGYIIGSGEYTQGAIITLQAIANSGYKFKCWSDDQNAEAIRNITVAKSKTYTAIFEPVYVSYDSIFNFQRWWDNGIEGLGGAEILKLLSGNYTSGVGLRLSSEGQDAQTTQSPVYKVEKGKKYIFEIDENVSGAGNPNFQTFVFYCDDKNGSWSKGTHTEGPDTLNKTKYTFTPTTNYIRIRCDIDGTGQYPCIAMFNNFRIYPEDYPWASNSLPVEQRSNSINWDIPLPERYRYTFDSWQDIDGNIYNNNSTYPTQDLTLYSRWKEINLFKELLKSSQIYYENQLASDIYFEGTKL